MSYHIEVRGKFIYISKDNVVLSVLFRDYSLFTISDLLQLHDDFMNKYVENENVEKMENNNSYNCGGN